MLLKCELMLLKCQINTNTKKKLFFHPAKCLERLLKYLYLVSIIFIINFLKQCLRIFVCWSWILIALAHTLIALIHPNTIINHITYYFSRFQQFHIEKGVQVIICIKIKIRIMSSVNMLKHNIIYKRCLVILNKLCLKRLKLSSQLLE